MNIPGAVCKSGWLDMIDAGFSEWVTQRIQTIMTARLQGSVIERFLNSELLDALRATLDVEMLSRLEAVTTLFGSSKGEECLPCPQLRDKLKSSQVHASEEGRIRLRMEPVQLINENVSLEELHRRELCAEG